MDTSGLEDTHSSTERRGHQVEHVPEGEIQLKARLVAGGDQQNKNLYDDLSAPTVSTAAVFTDMQPS
jgi:hypothetical protein